MTIDEYKKNLRKPLRPRTATFLLKDNSVLLGMKRRGFGKGYYLGIGGKVEENEEIEKAAIRELEEEIQVHVSLLDHRGILNFYFPHIEDESWNQQVHVFIATKWQGTPAETEEIKPQWFSAKSIPYTTMWDDAHYWLPIILDGKKTEAEFVFDNQLKVIDHVIKFV